MPGSVQRMIGPVTMAIDLKHLDEGDAQAVQPTALAKTGNDYGDVLT